MTIIVGWSEIAQTLPRLDLTSILEDGFAAYSNGDAIVPPVGELVFRHGETHIKYGYIRGDATFVVKVATGFYDNPARGLNSSNGLFLLFDATTGVPVAILLDEGHLTDIRTAVAGAIAAKHLAPNRIDTIGVIGCGTQARLQVRYLRDVTTCRRIQVYGRNDKALESYCADLASDGYEVSPVATVSDLAAKADLIVTATSAKEALLMAEDVRPGTHITAVGADTAEKCEIDPALFAKADLVVADSAAQCSTSGEIHHAIARGFLSASKLIELGAIVSGKVPGRTSERQITIADLTGVAVQDIRIAQAVFAAVQDKRAAA